MIVRHPTIAALRSPAVSGSISAVIFDFGGVLVTSPFTAMRQWAESNGHDADTVMEIFLGPYHDDGDHPFHRAERGELSAAEFRPMIQQLADDRAIDISTARGLGSMVPIPSMVERARKLRSDGYRTALLSNTIREFASLWRTLVPIDELFEVIIESAAVGMRKPNPTIYRLALDRLGSPAPETVVFLDDHPGNIAGAAAVGLQTILVGDDPAPALAELDRLLAS